MGVIALISVIIYVIAIMAIYHNLYNFEKSKKIKFIITGCIVMFVLSLVLVWISSGNLEVPNKEFKAYEGFMGITKRTSVLLFAPINAILILPYVGNLLNRFTEKRISEGKLKKKFLIVLIVMVVVGVFEMGYIRDFQIGLLSRI